MLFGENEIAVWARINLILMLFVTGFFCPTSTLALSQHDLSWIRAQQSKSVDNRLSTADKAWISQQQSGTKTLIQKVDKTWINKQRQRNKQILKKVNQRLQEETKNKVKTKESASFLKSEKNTPHNVLDVFSNLEGDSKDANDNGGAYIHPPQDNILIFISFSMPENSIKAWLTQANRLHVPLILRGLVENDFLKTRTKINALLKEGKGAIQIDPLWYHSFDITHVPAVVVQGRDGFDVALGDVGLEVSLKAIVNRGDKAKSEAKIALDALKGARHV